MVIAFVYFLTSFLQDKTNKIIFLLCLQHSAWLGLGIAEIQKYHSQCSLLGAPLRCECPPLRCAV